ncbi:MAG TPA: hypothetical protein PLE33_04810 [Candidatus Cloacimonas sp.]|nr:hypothetical protein [Candidatus Cloacimonas sp.]
MRCIATSCLTLYLSFFQIDNELIQYLTTGKNCQANIQPSPS